LDFAKKIKGEVSKINPSTLYYTKYVRDAPSILKAILNIVSLIGRNIFIK